MKVYWFNTLDIDVGYDLLHRDKAQKRRRQKAAKHMATVCGSLSVDYESCSIFPENQINPSVHNLYVLMR